MKRDHNYILYKFSIPLSLCDNFESSLFPLDEVPGFWQGSPSLKLKNENHYWCLKTIYPHALVFIFDFDDIYLGAITWNIFDKYFVQNTITNSSSSTG